MHSRRNKNLSFQETLTKMIQISGLRRRLLTTIGLLLLARLGIYIPIPGIDGEQLKELIKHLPQLGQVLNTFTGDGLSNLGIFSLGILPFINASILLQLLTSAIPRLEHLQKNEGELGRRKLSQITRYLTLGVALIQSTGLSIFLIKHQVSINPGFPFMLQTILALTAGSMLVMWISELISLRGIGNGSSLLIFISVISALPQNLKNSFEIVKINLDDSNQAILIQITLFLVLFLVTIVGIVCIQEAMRRIPLVSAKVQVTRRESRKRKTYLPLRLLSTGVMPIIFASSVIALPTLFLSDLPLSDAFRPDKPIYFVLYGLLIVTFSFLYSSLNVNALDISQNLKKMGMSLPNIRPGKTTSKYLEKVINCLGFLGGIFLAVIAILPNLVANLTEITTFSNLTATSLLIIVGVGVDTGKQIKTYIISERYQEIVRNSRTHKYLIN